MKKKLTDKIYYRLILFTLTLAAAGAACRRTVEENVQYGNSNSPQANSLQPANEAPTIELAGARTQTDGYRIIDADRMRITVHAAAPAQEAQIFYQPVTAQDDQILRLKTVIPTEVRSDIFETELKTSPDFNGEIWAQIRYATGATRETQHLKIAAAEITQKEVAAAAPSQAATPKSPSVSSLAAPDTPESARSDKLTNGLIERVPLKTGDGNIKITVNIPAFTMTLWQDNKEIKSYFVGVGRKNYPMPVGMRDADRIILNPDWIPPNSSWVRKSGLEPYTRIPASSPRNPLGKIKIPLGDAYLLHEADSPEDLGNLVSHGCVRVLRSDLFDLTKRIVAAKNLLASGIEIKAARQNSKRTVINLNGAMPVDINYDTMVVEKGVLSIYPDVYEHGTNTADKLRAELESYGVAGSLLNSKMLLGMLGRAGSREKFVISIDDIKNGHALTAGKTEPLTPQQAKK